MVSKTFCNVCGAEIENPAGMPHNTAANYTFGSFQLLTGVMAKRLDDLCGNCAEHVAKYIDHLKEAAAHEKESEKNGER